MTEELEQLLKNLKLRRRYLITGLTAQTASMST